MGEGCNLSECPMVQRLERQLDEFHKSNADAHQKFYESINELRTNDAVQDSRYETILSKLNEVTVEVKSLQATPGDNWRSLVKNVISTIVSIAVGYALAKLGIGG